MLCKRGDARLKKELACTSKPPSFRVLMTASTELLPKHKLNVSLAPL